LEKERGKERERVYGGKEKESYDRGRSLEGEGGEARLEGGYHPLIAREGTSKKKQQGRERGTFVASFWGERGRSSIWTKIGDVGKGGEKKGGEKSPSLGFGDFSFANVARSSRG